MLTKKPILLAPFLARGALSFDFGKVITTGEGGMVLSNEHSIDKKAREYHDHGHENNPSLPRGRDTRTNYGFNYRMTEMQGAVGKVQLSKLDYIINENYKRYNSLEKMFPSNLNKRNIPVGSEPIYDTFIFFTDFKDKKENYIKILNEEGFGTKNLPDAMEWHCTYFWDHALNQEQITHSKITKELLEKAIAIPISLNKSIENYSNLGKKLFT